MVHRGRIDLSGIDSDSSNSSNTTIKKVQNKLSNIYYKDCIIAYWEDKYMKQKIIIIFISSLLTILFGIIYFNYNCDIYIYNTLFFDIIMAFTAFFGVFGIIFQSQRTKNIEEAQFIFELNKEFINNETYQKVLDLLMNNSIISPTKEEVSLITQYCSYFESIYIMVEKKIINLSLIDSLFCYRFFNVINNKCVQEFIITPNKEYLNNIIKLHYIWKKYRLKRKYDNNIPLLHTDLSLLPWYNDFIKKKL